MKSDKHVITRNGISYEVDLTEGMELSMFLFGGFQGHVTNNSNIQVPQDGVIFDVGANVGIMTLQFAQVVPDGKVYAFEPTHYAYAKLKRNLELNAELSENIEVTQTLVGSEVSEQSDMTAYSSWKVGGKDDEEKHQVHGGSQQSTEGIGCITLDHFANEKNIDRIDLIKIDTDGYELEILKGAESILKSLKPLVIFEIGLYLLQEHDISFDDFHAYLTGLGYSIHNSDSMEVVTPENAAKHIPQKGTVDLLAIHRE